MDLFAKTYAIDWDGTVVDEGQYPHVGEPKPNAVNVMNRIVESGGRIIIWTCRGGRQQEEAIAEKLYSFGFTNFIVNRSYQDVLDFFGEASPKAYADVYIDDRGLFTKKVDWFEIEEILFPKTLDKS